TDVELRGLTLTGAGVIARGASTLRLTSLHVDHTVDQGVRALGPGASLLTNEVWIDGTQGARDVFGLSVHTGGRGVVARTAVRAVTGAGIGVLGGAVNLVESSVTATTSIAGSPADDGRALSITGGGTVQAMRVAVDGNIGGVQIDGAGSGLTWTDGVLRGSDASGRTVCDRALVVGHGGRATLTQVFLADAMSSAVVVDGAGSVVDLHDSVLRHFGPAVDAGQAATYVLLASAGGAIHAQGVRLEDAMNGQFVFATAGGSVDLTHCTLASPNAIPGTLVTGALVSGGTFSAAASVFDASLTLSMYCTSPGSRATVTDSVLGATAVFAEGAQASIATSTFAGASGEAVMLSDPGTFAEVTGSLITRTRGQAGHASVGIYASAGAHLSGRRLLLSHNDNYGVLVSGQGTELSLSDSAIIDTLEATVGAGSAASASDGATLHLERVWIDGAHTAGLFAISGTTTIDATDLLVTNTAPGSLGLGAGVQIGEGGTLTGTRLAVRGGVGAGIEALSVTTLGGVPASIHLDHAFVRGVRSGPVQYDGQTHQGTGAPVSYALHVGQQGQLDAMRTTIEACGYGVAAGPGAIRLTDGVITGQLDAAGVEIGGGMVSLLRVSVSANARNEVLHRDDLPAGSSLPPPSPVCPPGGC
ncbi:MAG: hypothetical protein WCJ30_07160, partial [Deltaproteobacteria bacterium]